MLPTARVKPMRGDRIMSSDAAPSQSSLFFLKSCRVGNIYRGMVDDREDWSKNVAWILFKQ